MSSDILDLRLNDLREQACKPDFVEDMAKAERNVFESLDCKYYLYLLTNHLT